MIRIIKATCPDVLLTAGRKARRKLCQDYTKHLNNTGIPKTDLQFKDGIHNHASVKVALIESQHGKCCYCETHVGAMGDVDHFRPRSASSQAPGSEVVRPGYYWLAYEWDNLYLSCTGCNQRYKHILFPLADPNSRATSHTASLLAESPLFINPGGDHPEVAIGFDKWYSVSVKGSTRGTVTIDLLGLNRPDLVFRRKEHLTILQILAKLVDSRWILPDNPTADGLIADAQRKLASYLVDSAEFAAMARSAKANDYWSK